MIIKKLINNLKFKHLLNSINIGNIDALNGVEFEQFISNFMEYLGFNVNLTATTGDNGIDIIAKRGKTLIGIQTKLYYNHNVGNKAIQEVFSGKSYYKLTHALAITNVQFSGPAKQLANQLGVALIDRKMLTAMLKNSKKQIFVRYKPLENEIAE